MPTLQPITSKEQVAAKHHAIVDDIARSRGAIQGPFTMFLHCPELAGRVAHLGAFVRFEGALDMRARVVAAMTVAREFEAVYVWGAQTGGARRQGVPEATITSIRENHSRGIPPDDAEIVDFTRQLRRLPGRGSDLQHFGVRSAFELAGVHRHGQHAVIPDGAGQLDEPLIAEPLPK